jgi:hypothetical protein
MTSRSAAPVAQPSWGSARPAPREARRRPAVLSPWPDPSRGVCWGTRGRVASDVAAGAALLAATAGLWTAFLLAVW